MPLEGRRATDYDHEGRSVMSPADRRAMKATIPLWKRPIYCIFQERTLLVIACVAAIAVGAVSIKKAGENADRSDRAATLAADRDEARKYQRCTQTVSQANAQNNTNRVFRSALLTSRSRMLLQVDRTSDPVLRRRYKANAAKYAEDRDKLTFALVPDCRKTYPRGFDLSATFPDLAPARPPAEDMPPR